MRDARTLEPGAIVGPYRVEHRLGGGASGDVYRAVHEHTGARVALKVAHGADDDARSAHAREVHAGSVLRHPNIAAVYEAGEFDGRPWIALELVEGTSLRAHVGDRVAPVARRVAWATAVARALAAAHDVGVVHRDIKPDNVMIAADGTVKVLDFGLAHRRSVACTLSSWSAAGRIVGTPAYMAPEQALGRKDLTGAVDQFSAAVVLYEMLSGTLPQRLVSNIAEAIAARATAPMIPLEQARAGLPAGLVEAVMRALAHDPRARFPSVEAFRDAVAPFASAPRPSPPPPPVIEAMPPPPSASRAVGLVVGVSVVVCLLVVGGALVLRSSDPSRVEPRATRPPTTVAPTPLPEDASLPRTVEVDGGADTHEAPVTTPDDASAQPAAPAHHHGGRHRRHRESTNEPPPQDPSDLRAR